MFCQILSIMPALLIYVFMISNFKLHARWMGNVTSLKVLVSTYLWCSVTVMQINTFSCIYGHKPEWC